MINIKKLILIMEVIMKKNQIIRCNVYDCKYCDTENITCSLKEIKVANCSHNLNKESTMCDNYKIRKD